MQQQPDEHQHDYQHQLPPNMHFTYPTMSEAASDIGKEDSQSNSELAAVAVADDDRDEQSEHGCDNENVRYSRSRSSIRQSNSDYDSMPPGATATGEWLDDDGELVAVPVRLHGSPSDESSQRSSRTAPHTEYVYGDDEEDEVRGEGMQIEHEREHDRQHPLQPSPARPATAPTWPPPPPPPEMSLREEHSLNQHPPLSSRAAPVPPLIGPPFHNTAPPSTSSKHAHAQTFSPVTVQPEDAQKNDATAAASSSDTAATTASATITAPIIPPLEKHDDEWKHDGVVHPAAAAAGGAVLQSPHHNATTITASTYDEERARTMPVTMPMQTSAQHSAWEDEMQMHGAHTTVDPYGYDRQWHEHEPASRTVAGGSGAVTADHSARNSVSSTSTNNAARFLIPPVVIPHHDHQHGATAMNKTATPAMPMVTPIPKAYTPVYGTPPHQDTFEHCVVYRYPRTITILLAIAWIALLIASFGAGPQGFVFEPPYINPALGPTYQALDQLGGKVTWKIVGVSRGALGGSSSEGYRLLTSVFWHAGLIPWVLSMIALVWLGGHLEREVGPVRMPVVAFGSAIWGTIFSAIFVTDRLTVSASAVIFGLIGARAIDAVMYRHWYTRAYSLRTGGLLILSTIVGFIIGLLPLIDNWANLGALLMGVIMGGALLLGPWRIAPDPIARTTKRSQLHWVPHYNATRYACLALALVLWVVALAVLFTVVEDRVKENPTQSWCDGCDAFQCIETSAWTCDPPNYP